MASKRRHVRIWPPLLIGYLLNSFVLVNSKEVELLDSSKLDKLNWTTYPVNNGDEDNGQWSEENSGIYSIYMACAVDKPTVNNWLRMPYVDRQGANSLHIEITFSMRQCSTKHSANLQQCKETFNLYYYEAGSDFGNQQLPSWDERTYTKVAKVAGEVYKRSSDITDNVKSFPVAVGNGRRGVYFAIQDEGACVVIKKVRIFYVTCEEVTGNFAYFPETPTASESYDVVEQTGECVPNAVEKTKLTYICQSIGEWYGGIKGECVCEPGYEGNQTSSQCTACPRDSYKWSEGIGPCKPCPGRSLSNKGAAECSCYRGSWRSPTDPKDMPCTTPPSAPINPSVTSQSSTSSTVSWDEPLDLGGRNDLNYRVNCPDCSSDVLYSPGWRGLSKRSVTLNNLDPGKTYRVDIYAENGVTNMSLAKPSFESVKVTTQSLGKIINLRRTNLETRTLTVSWDLPPSMKGHVLKFQVRYYPSQEVGKLANRFTGTQNFTLSEFMLDTEYVFVVRGETEYGWGEFSDPLVVKTGKYGSTIVGVRRIKISAKNITIAWDVAKSVKNSIRKYEVRYYPKSQRQNVMSKETYVQSLSITDLMPDTEYEFQVRCLLLNEWSDHSEALVVRTAPSESTSTPIGIIVGSIVAVILCMAIATIMIIILLRKNRPNCSEKKDCDAYSHVIQYPPLEHHINGGYGGLTMPLFPSPGSVHSSVRTYVDPHTYEDPNQAVREFTREIDACHITIESVIGGGEFGDVCKGKLRLPGRLEMVVAIKTLKPGATEKNRLDFLTEASIMGQFDDPNVIFLEGVVTKSNPIMIVTEYMANGSLDTFLRNNDGKFTIIQLVGMMRGIASGMKYLSEMGFVHRDLAARNILVNETLVCKVADFGLSREVESDTTDGAYTTTGGKIPVRWTAPEAIAFRKFTSSSDVWSYGVVMWEIVSYGERPYYNWSNQDVIKAVDKGYRLPPPMDCPEAIHQLMLDSWQKERSHRPKLGQIVKTLEKLIRAPELLRKQAKPRPHNFIDPSAPDMTALSNVEDWLVSIKMERYLTLFMAADLTTMEQVRHITVRDLLNMGINLVGHQKKIMNSIQTFRAQTGENVQPNFAQAALV